MNPWFLYGVLLILLLACPSFASSVFDIRFDEGTGIYANDSSGNNRNGTWLGSNPYNWTAGKSGWGGNFSPAKSSRVILSGTPGTGNSNVTIRAWVYLNNITQRQTIFADTRYGLEIGNGIGAGTRVGQVGLVRYGVGMGAETISNSILLRDWMRIVYTKSGNGNNSAIWINGLKQPLASSYSFIWNGSGINYLGTRNSSQYLNGTLDNVSYDNAILTDDEIIADYTNSMPPAVTAGSPMGSNVPITAHITVNFSKAMNKASAQSAFSISPATKGSFSWTGNTMIYTPDVNLSAGATYTVMIGTDARDLEGNSMQIPYSWQFTTESDIIIPTLLKVIENTPEGTNVPVDTLITVSFSKAMNRVSVQSAFSTSPATTGSFSWAKNSMIYTPDVNLSAGTTYTVIIGTGARDLEGNNMQIPYSWQFTTELDVLPHSLVSPVFDIRFDEGIGIYANDSSGNNYNGIWGGTNPYNWTAGKSGWGGNFSPVKSSKITLAGTPSSDASNNVTILAWVYLNSITGRQTIWADASYGLEMGNGIGGGYKTGQVGLVRYGVGTAAATINDSISPNRWMRVVYTKSANPNKSAIWINGKRLTLDANSIFEWSGTGTNYLGARNNSQFLNGTLDNVSYYNRTLRDDEIIADYTNSLISHVQPQFTDNFSIIFMPDPQFYSRGANYSGYPVPVEIYGNMTNWIRNNIGSQSIAFVTSAGDVVDAGANITQWEVAHSAFLNLDGQVPYLINPGNHEYQNIASRSLTNFNLFFNYTRYQNYSYFDGWNSTANRHGKFSAVSGDYEVITLEACPTDATLNWLNDTLTTYISKKVIIVTHAYLTTLNRRMTVFDTGQYPCGSGMRFTDYNNGEDIYNEVLKYHNNVFMVLSGHVSTLRGLEATGFLQNITLDNHYLTQLLTNTQDMEAGGNGYLRIYRIFPLNDTVVVQTYSPYINSYLTDSKNFFRFRMSAKNIYSGINTSIYYNNTVLYDVNPWNKPLLNFDIVPSSDSINVNVTSWNTSGDYYRKWDESSTNTNVTVQYTIGDLLPFSGYYVKIRWSNGMMYQDIYTSNSTGYITYNQTGYEYARHTEITLV